jgi:hypothetical protein
MQLQKCVWSWKRFARAVLCGGLILIGAQTQAMPSADPRDVATVTVNGVKYSVIADHEDPLRWYYLPNMPVLAERNNEPIFNLLRYQFQGKNAQELMEGGILTFAVTMELPTNEDVIKQQIADSLRNIAKAPALPTDGSPQNAFSSLARARVALEKLKGRAPEASDINLSALSYREAKIAVYAPGGEGLVGAGGTQDRMAPSFATQAMPFTVTLTSKGTDVYEKLTTGNTGVQVLYDLTYDAMTPLVGFKVDVNWTRISEHTSQNIKNRNSFAANIAGAVNVEAAVGVNDNKVADYLTSNDFIKIYSVTGEGFTEEDCKRLLDPIVESIRDKAFAKKDLYPDQLEKPTAKAASADALTKKDVTLDELEAKAAAKKKKDSKKSDDKEEEAADSTDDKEPADEDTDKPADEPADEPADAPADEPMEDADAGDGKTDNKNDDAKEPDSDKGSIVSELIPTFKTETNISMNYEYMKSTGTETFEYSAQKIVQRKTSLGGFVGIGGYFRNVKPENLKKDPLYQRLITEVGRSDAWQSAYFYLPAVSTELTTKLGVTEVDLVVRLEDKQGKGVGNQKAVFFRGGNWIAGSKDAKTGEKLSLGRVAFPLLGRGELSNLNFRVTQTILRPGSEPESLKDEYIVPAFDGEKPLASARDNMRIIQVRSNLLRSLGKDIEEVAIRLTAGGRTRSEIISTSSQVVNFEIPRSADPNAKAQYDVELQFVTGANAADEELRDQVITVQLSKQDADTLYLRDSTWKDSEEAKKLLGK